MYLEDLWRFGIPQNLRRTFWPLKIQNKLSISKQLYRINKEQGLNLIAKATARTNQEAIPAIGTFNVLDE